MLTCKNYVYENVPEKMQKIQSKMKHGSKQNLLNTPPYTAYPHNRL